MYDNDLHNSLQDQIDACPSEVEKYREARGPEWRKAFDALREYQLTNIKDEDGCGYPIVDLLTRDGVSIADGESELVMITDEIMMKLDLSLEQKKMGELHQRILGTLDDFAGMQPEEGEEWESWYRASFDLARDKIARLLDSRRAEH